MPKIKTKSGAKKRFKLTASGRVRSQFAFKRHNLRKRSTSMKRKARGMKVLGPQETRVIKRYFLPGA